ncbi:Predicted ABC-type ATPase [Planctomicrobium piriforme]|uniref:Predicted ABC-type ATPase n=2 Tax=Planctomicrobium piriforme TaxID=1576369 RepID=A0A1I3AW90_9PLAN|nr:Predicted ABC-type ATPase [Planctomicrobium piriforme]
MTDNPPRLRMFAGPNGSGKTTIKNGLQKSDEWFGLYINPDDLERTARETGLIPLDAFGLPFATQELRAFFAASTLLQLHGLSEEAQQIEVCDHSIHFYDLSVNSYHASVLADFLRRKSLELSRSFSFETVMSAPDKVELLRQAQLRGFRTYLYYVATEDPDINVARVQYRVAEGGHDVPANKIEERYYRSLKLLPKAMRYSNRAFLFDTSQEVPWFFAEGRDGEDLRLKSQEMPNWFQPAWDSFGSAESD